jgi:hypothetical protein
VSFSWGVFARESRRQSCSPGHRCERATRDFERRATSFVRGVTSKQKDVATLKAVVRAITERQDRLNALEADLRAAQRVTGTVSIRSLLGVTEGGSSRFTKSASPAGLVPFVNHPALRFDGAPAVSAFRVEVSA